MDEISSGGPRGSIGGREATMGEDMDGGVVDGRHGRSSWEDRRLTRRNMYVLSLVISDGCLFC